MILYLILLRTHKSRYQNSFMSDGCSTAVERGAQNLKVVGSMFFSSLYFSELVFIVDRIVTVNLSETQWKSSIIYNWVADSWDLHRNKSLASWQRGPTNPKVSWVVK